MTNNINNRERGFIGSIITIILGIALISFIFDWNVVDFIKSNEFQSFWSYLKKFLDILWQDYISRPAMFVWNEIVVDIIWKWSQEAFGYIKGWIDSK